MIRLFVALIALIEIAVPASTDPAFVAVRHDAYAALAHPLLSRQVTLYVPDSRPVTLPEALRAIATQTGAVIRLDIDVPPDVQFSGRFTRTPLSLVLDAFAKTGAFKWFPERDGTLRISPHDDMRVLWRGREISGEACAVCKRPLDASWKFCPWCGRTVTVETAPAHRPAEK